MRYTWIKRNPEKYGNNRPLRDALICSSPMLIYIAIVIYFFVSWLISTNAHADSASNLQNEKKILSVELVKNTLVIAYKETSVCLHAFNCSESYHTRVYKEIYKGRLNEVYLSEIIEGKYMDGYYVNSKIEWPEK